MLKKLDVMVPDLQLQKRFADYVEQVNLFGLTIWQKSAIRQSLDKLEVLKKSLMQEYFAP